MKSSSREFLEHISKECSQQLTYYRFNRGTLHVSEKYRNGRLSALDYLQELAFYYFQKERGLKEQFVCDLQKQLGATCCLNDGDYKRGIQDAINDAINKVTGI